MQAETEKLELENTLLKSRNQWLENVTQKMIVMIGNAASVLEEYAKTTNQLAVELEKTRDVYSRLHSDLQEAFNETSATTDRLPEAEQADADA